MTMLMMLLKQTKFPQYVNISMDPILRRNQEKKTLPKIRTQNNFEKHCYECVLPNKQFV